MHNCKNNESWFWNDAKNDWIWKGVIYRRTNHVNLATFTVEPGEFPSNWKASILMEVEKKMGRWNEKKKRNKEINWEESVAELVFQVVGSRVLEKRESAC